MRDQLLERSNAYLTASRRACEAAREEARVLNEGERIVSEIGNWCRLVLFKTDILENRSEGQELSDLLSLPPEKSPSQPFELVRDSAKRQSLQDGFSALLEDSAHDQKAVAAWLFGPGIGGRFRRRSCDREYVIWRSSSRPLETYRIARADIPSVR